MTAPAKLDTLQSVELAEGVEIRLRIAGPLPRASAYLIDLLIRVLLLLAGIIASTLMGIALGGRKETFAGLSGVGDLIVTCFSEHSRNHRVGLALGKGQTLEEAVAELQAGAEAPARGRVQGQLGLAGQGDAMRDAGR
jgi:hypothetical protein